MPIPDFTPGDGEHLDHIRPPAEFTAEGAVATVLALSEQGDSDAILSVMFLVQGQLEKRVGVMSTHNPDFASFVEALATVTAIIEIKVSSELDKTINPPGLEN